MTLATDITPTAQGKVRDLYDLGEQLLFVASDRISAFDYVLPSEIPYKGEVLTRLSLFWFRQLADLVPNHCVSADIACLPEPFTAYANELAGRFMLVKKARMFPVECIARGYLAGSGLKEYEASGTVCGIELPQGLTNSSRLVPPLYTPSSKAELGSHDENISYEQTVERLGEQDAAALRRLSLALYARARDIADARGLIIADTKFEFGRVGTGSTAQILLADEVLTPDSSRFWPKDGYTPGREQPSYDKQFVRDWLTANWDRTAEPDMPPPLPPSVVEQTSRKYVQAYEMLTNERFIPAADLL
ncbi:MAG: phosphoribosylaminoimidazolesuccinocarboxamide synthase [Coriobacteriales bacterium]|jgi:phosphoribosylaminoimidazole-succinocarboxamide synthase|nr:phosphoribosylaminoimidazolesuccinocarboxamide synthase [Coriobacteriales bacterium]